MKISELQREQKRLVEEKGFSLSLDEMYKHIALVHSEVSEFADVWKKEKDIIKLRERGGEEIADIVIRACHLANILKVDLEKCCEGKMEENFNRPFRYNEVR